MKSIASLSNLPRDLDGLRNRVVEIIAAENELLAVHQLACERIAQLLLVECKLQNEYLFPGVARFGANFDEWWDDLPEERAGEVGEMLDSLHGRPLKVQELEHAAWSAYMDAFNIEESCRAES